jgi:putative hydrolase of the HAD superfamily
MNDVDPGRVKAVVFDLGGVFLEGGPSHVRAFGDKYGIPRDAWAAIRDELFITGDWWNRVERAELTLDEFARELQARVSAVGVPLTLDQARQFMGTPGTDTESRLRQEVVDACLRLRTYLPTALLTNNIREWRDGWRRRIPVDALFDVVVDSSDVGMRKPEPAIYRIVESRLGMPGKDLLFVDDLGVNLKTAKSLGWQTVKYDDTSRVLSILNSIWPGRMPRQGIPPTS